MFTRSITGSTATLLAYAPNGACVGRRGVATGRGLLRRAASEAVRLAADSPLWRVALDQGQIEVARWSTATKRYVNRRVIR